MHVGPLAIGRVGSGCLEESMTAQESVPDRYVCDTVSPACLQSHMVSVVQVGMMTTPQDVLRMRNSNLTSPHVLSGLNEPSPCPYNHYVEVCCRFIYQRSGACPPRSLPAQLHPQDRDQ